MSEYLNDHIRRSMRINRVSAGEAIKASRKAASAESRIRAALLRLSDAEFSGPARERAIKTISDILAKQYGDAYEDASKLAEKIVKAEVEWQISTFSQYANSPVNLVPIEEAIKISQTIPYQGKTFNQWFQEAGLKSSRKAFGVIESGYINGKSIPDIVADVQALSKKALPDIRTLVRSNVLHASAIGRAQVMEANSDIIEGKIWNSVLDVRTTANICGVRDQLVYDNNNQPVGHSLPWGAGPGQIHFNCRSIEIAKLTGVDISAKRPSVGAGKEYERGDNKTRTGTVRKPTKANRDNDIFKITMRQSNTNYESWLRTQKKDFVADALGSYEKASEFKSGVSLFDLTNNPLGNPLTINQL